MNDPHAPTSLESVQLADLADQVIVESPPAAAGGEAAEGFAGITPPRRRGGAARFISDVIVELGFLPQARVDAAVEEGKAAGRSPEEVLLQSGALSADELARATGERFGLDHVDLTVYKPDLSAVNLLTPPAARRYNAVPIGFHSNGHLLVAGEKQIGVNHNVDVLRFSGQVDPRAIQPGNSVASAQIANVRIEQRGRGAQADAQGIGWLGRFFLNVLPI